MRKRGHPSDITKEGLPQEKRPRKNECFVWSSLGRIPDDLKCHNSQRFHVIHENDYQTAETFF